MDSYMERRTGNLDLRFGLNSPKFVLGVLLPKVNVSIAMLRSVLREGQEQVLWEIT